jgi:plastocyanin
MIRMPSLLRPASGLLLAAVALALVVGWTALAGPPGGIEVTVNRPDGSSKSILASEVEPDIDGPYTLRQTNGTKSQVDVVDGVSIRELLAATQSELNYVSVEFPGPNGRTIKLTREQIDAAVPRPPALYSDDTGATWFIRSPTSSTDANARDHFKIAPSAITIDQIDDELEVKVKASRTRIEAGESVDFTAVASPKGDYRYNWTFEPGVGKKDAGTTPSHTFKKEGTYKVAVGVYVGPDQESDGGGGIRIQVGDPKKSDKDREGGGDNTSTGAPSSGTSTGSSGAGSSYGSGSTYTPTPTTPTPTPPATSAPEPTEPDIATSGTPVEGNLLADVSEPPPSNILESARRAARDGNPQDANDGDVGVSEAAVSVFAALALLGLGAGIETRQGRLPRLRLPRRSA